MHTHWKYFHFDTEISFLVHVEPLTDCFVINKRNREKREKSNNVFFWDHRKKKRYIKKDVISRVHFECRSTH